MVAALSYFCPNLADAVEAEATIMRRWDKGAKSVYDENKRLQIWEPKS
jgi:hypothetical protein